MFTYMTFSRDVRRLPLHDYHARKGAKFGTFGEWEVPLSYTTIVSEHEAVRTRAGVFDISHMGEIRVRGGEAEAFLERLLPRNIRSVQEGQAIYSPLLNKRGGIVDDVIVYRYGKSDFLFIVNAGNVEKDQRWIRSLAPPGVEVVDISEEWGLLAVQGPESAVVIERLFGREYAQIKPYHFTFLRDGMLARTGYTGEDGFEILWPREDLPALWQDLVERNERGAVPAGFGARDTLRLEAGMLLYGHDIDETTTPLEAGLSWCLAFEKTDFMGRSALIKQKEEGIKRCRVGLEMIERGIPRQGYEVSKRGRTIGHITSGSFSPTLKKNIGMAYVVSEEAEVGTEVEVMVRGNPLSARLVELPFYKRKTRDG